MRASLPKRVFNSVFLGLAVGGAAVSAQAQQPGMATSPNATYSPCQCGPCPTPPNAQPGTSESSGTPATEPTAQTPSFDLPRFGAGIGSNLAFAAPAASGASVATAGNGTAVLVTTPVILPGLLTATAAQSALPLDRVWFNYGYFDGFRINNPASLTTGGTAVVPGSGTERGFNLNVFDLGVEKTFLGGWASIYLDLPLLYAADNISGQNISGLGNINVGFKGILFKDSVTGSLLTGGLTVSVPTAHETLVSSTVCTLNPASPTGVYPAPTTTTSLNPTYIQPWVAGLMVMDRFYIQEYFGVVVPTDDRVSTILNNNLIAGLNVYQDRCQFISSVTPIVGAQCLIPVSHAGTPGGNGTQIGGPGTFEPAAGAPPPPAPNVFGFPDQVFVTAGVQLGLGDRAIFSSTVVVPVVGPVGYSYGVTAGLSFFY